MGEHQTINIQGINVLVEFRDDDFTNQQIIVFIEPITFTKFAVLVPKPTTATEAAYNTEYAIMRYLPELNKIRQTIDMNDPYFQFRNQKFSETSDSHLNYFNYWNIRKPLIDIDYIKNAIVKINTDEENEFLKQFENANEPMETFTLW